MLNSFIISLKQLLRPLYNRIVVFIWRIKGSQPPPPHSSKQLALNRARKKYGYDLLIETGTFRGDMVEAQRRNFKKIISIELSPELHKAAVERFRKYQHIELLEGDSGEVLNDVMRTEDTPAIIWLDGHYSGGVTAKGKLNCPIYKELDAIFTNTSLPHTILIDDARFFNGQDDYPSLEYLRKYISDKEVPCTFSVKDDIIYILP